MKTDTNNLIEEQKQASSSQEAISPANATRFLAHMQNSSALLLAGNTWRTVHG